MKSTLFLIFSETSLPEDGSTTTDVKVALHDLRDALWPLEKRVFSPKIN